MEEVCASRSNTTVPAGYFESVLKLSWFVEDLDDAKLPAVVELTVRYRIPGIGEYVICGRRFLRSQRIDEEHLAARFERDLHFRPEQVELVGWDVRKPEAEKHEVESLLGFPLKRSSRT